MPFTQFKANFSPETLHLLQDAFDSAWNEVVVSFGETVDEQSARDLLAKRIVEAARDHGETDPIRLKAYALEPFRA